MKKSRTQKAIVNFFTSVFYEITSLLVGLIVPRLILTNFGSAYNGITHSISQFISYIALMRAGIGGVTRAALYKPLSERNNEEISSVIMSTQKFMRKIAVIFVGFVLLFACIYPFIVTEFDWFFTASLIVVISISTFAEYYFGFTYQMLLMADQKSYVSILMTCGVTVLNGFVSIVLINSGFGIHIVKLANALVSCLLPLFLNIYVKKKYNINKNAIPSEEKIAQRWDAFAHEIASFIRNNSDIVILTLFSNMYDVSVYTVYHYVTANIKKIVEMCTSSFDAAFGNMHAKNELELMNENLSIFELIVFSLVGIINSVALVMIVPFIMIYTKGVNDADYSRPLFSIVLILVSVFDNYRIPYKTIVTSCGHYKQTRNGAVVECLLNVVISSICVIKFGLIGVVIGSLCAVIFRTLQFVVYLSKNILNRSISYFIKHLFINSIIMIAVYLISSPFVRHNLSIFDWIIDSCITTLIASSLTLITDYLFYKKDMNNLFKKIFKKDLFKC